MCWKARLCFKGVHRNDLYRDGMHQCCYLISILSWSCVRNITSLFHKLHIYPPPDHEPDGFQSRHQSLSSLPEIVFRILVCHFLSYFCLRTFLASPSRLFPNHETKFNTLRKHVPGRGIPPKEIALAKLTLYKEISFPYSRLLEWISGSDDAYLYVSGLRYHLHLFDHNAPRVWSHAIIWNQPAVSSVIPQSHHTLGPRTGCSRDALNKNRTSTHGARTGPVRCRTNFS